jgi:hypothetical protein
MLLTVFDQVYTPLWDHIKGNYKHQPFLVEESSRICIKKINSILLMNELINIFHFNAF